MSASNDLYKSGLSKSGLSKLDLSMVRCGVRFIFSYRFAGKVKVALMDKSVNQVIGNVQRFQRRIAPLKNYNGQWQDLSDMEPLFTVKESVDLEQVVAMAYREAGCIKATVRNPPMFFTLFTDKADPEHFVLMQSGEHSYCDGKSAILLFNQVLRYYNALVTGDEASREAIIEQVTSLCSPSPQDIYALSTRSQQSLINVGRLRHVKNTLSLMTYKVSDTMPYATPHKALPTMLEQYRASTDQPSMKRLSIEPLIRYCEEKCPQVSPHNLICALLAKTNHTLSCHFKPQTNNPMVSFRVMVDILNMPMRQKCIGNYIAYLPVTIDTRRPLFQIATEINQRLYQAKLQRAEVSMYKLLEFALGSGMANKVNDPVAFIIANIDNISLNFNPEMLQGATLQNFQVTANAIPKDIGGAQLNNRPTICFNLASEHQLLISFFNTVTDPEISRKWLEIIDLKLQSLARSLSTVSC